ncbi:putative transmembrane protein, partial [Rhizoctonia solani 123E]
LIVDGFSNLALLAILFSGVQAQFISTTSSDNSNATARATNAVLFGGLILSVCSALLATLSGRWFSILREDDSEFLSSHWLAAESRQNNTPILEYLKFQKEDWLNKLPFQLQQQHYSQPLSPNGSKGDGISMWQNKMTGSPTQDSEMAEMEAGRSYGHMHGPTPTPRERDVQFVIRLIDEEMKGDTTIREKIVSKILLCAVAICCSAFALFAVGIMLLVWNTQPFDVALSTSILLGLNLILMPGFFLKHRHKRVISQLSLGRAAL